ARMHIVFPESTSSNLDVSVSSSSSSSHAFRITDALHALALFVQQSQHLLYLSLAYNDLPSSVLQVFVSAIANNTSLRVVDLKGNRIDVHVATALGSALAHNSTLLA